eukprot:g1865.t1
MRTLPVRRKRNARHYLQQKITPHRNRVIRWFQAADPVAKSRMLSQFGLAEVLSTKCGLSMEPRETTKLWTYVLNRVSDREASTQQTARDGVLINIYSVVDAIKTSLAPTTTTVISSSTPPHRSSGSYELAGIGELDDRRKRTVDRLLARTKASRTLLDANTALEFVERQLASKPHVIKLMFGDVGNAKTGRLTSHQLLELLRRLNIFVRKDAFVRLWRRFDRAKKGSINFSEFLAGIRREHRKGRVDDDPNSSFFCGAPSWDAQHLHRASQKTRRSGGISEGTFLADDALHVLADRALTQRDVCRRVFRNFDAEKSGALDKQRFEEALRFFQIKMSSQSEYDRLWASLATSAAGRDCEDGAVVDYRALLSRLASGSIAHVSKAAKTGSETGPSQRLSAKAALELLARDLKSSLSARRGVHTNNNGSVTSWELQRMLGARNIRLKPNAFRKLWAVLLQRSGGSSSAAVSLEDIVFGVAASSERPRSAGVARREGVAACAFLE